ncbi:MAG: hypothetical protein ABI577_07885 [bacterium]
MNSEPLASGFLARLHGCGASGLFHCGSVSIVVIVLLAPPGRACR